MVAKVYAETFIYSTVLCPSTNYMTMNKVHIKLTLNPTDFSKFFGLISTKSATIQPRLSESPLSEPSVIRTYRNSKG